MPSYEYLTPQHFVEWGMDIRPEEVTGVALRGVDGLIAIGGLWWVMDRWWAIFDARGPLPRHVHRAAIKVIEGAVQAGIEEVWAILDERKPRAEAWLRRFGFEPTGELDADGHPIWRLDLGERNDGGRRGDDSRREDTGRKCRERCGEVQS